MLQIEHNEGRSVAEFLDHRRNHHRTQAHRVPGNHDECDLKSQPHADESVVKRGMRDGRGVLAPDQIEHEIERREYQHAPNAGDPKHDLGEFHGTRLFAADREAVNAQRWRGHRAAKFEIVRDLGDVEEHFFQVSGYGDFFDGISELSARNPQAPKRRGNNRR